MSTSYGYLKLKKRVQQINSRAVVHEAEKGAIDPIILLGRETEETFADFGGWLSSAEESRSESEYRDQLNLHEHGTDQSSIRTFVVELEEPINRNEFNEFIQAFAIEFGENLLRTKGLLRVEDRSDQPAVIHGVQHVFFPIRWLDGWPGEDRTSKLVFITQGLESDIVQARFDERFPQVGAVPAQAVD